MNKVEETLLRLKQELDNSPVIQEYLQLKEVIESDDELKKTREDIARLASENKIAERDALLAIYNSHPVVVNYTQAEEEVRNLLNQIKVILSD